MKDKRTFGTINGLRGVAALVIVAYHSSLYDALNLKNGFLAVDFFFVLSGFIIAYSYDERLRKGGFITEFFLIRLVRLYPLYLLGTLIPLLPISLLAILKGTVIESSFANLRAVPFAFLMLPAPPTIGWQQGLFPLNGPAWSLFLVLVMNMLFALTVRLWTELRILFILICAASILVLEHRFGEISGGWNWVSVHMGILRVLYSFPAGVLIYKLYQKRTPLPSIPSPLIVALFIAFVSVPFDCIVPFARLIGLPILVALAARSEPSITLAPTYATIGTVSYAIYAIHLPLRTILAAVCHKFALPQGLPTDVVFIVLMAPACLLIHNLYDIPVRKYLGRKLLRRPEAGALNAVVRLKSLHYPGMDPSARYRREAGQVTSLRLRRPDGKLLKALAEHDGFPAGDEPVVHAHPADFAR